MKPIAKFGELPFYVGGICVFAATDKDANAISKELFIIGERSTRMFDLVTEDTSLIYNFMQMVNRDKDHKELSLSATAAELQQILGKNKFAVKVYDLDTGDVLGYAYKFFTNKIILSNGIEVEVVDFNRQTTEPAPVVVPVASVSLDKNTANGLVGQTDQLTPTVLPVDATDKSVTWSTSGAAASVSTSGLVTFLSNGSAYITATTVDGSHTAQCLYTITTAVESVSLAPATVSLSLSGVSTQSLTPTFVPATASLKTGTYTSSEDTIATVDSVGNIQAVGVGTATITFTTTDGNKTATCDVTVTA